MLRKYPVWIIFLITGLMPIILVVLYVLLSGIDPNSSEFFKSPGFALVIVLAHSSSFLVLLYILRKLNLELKDIGWKTWSGSSIIREVIIGLMLSFLIYIFKELVLDSMSALIHGRSPSFNSFFNFVFKRDEVVLMVIAFIFPFVEESVFRGFPYQQWKNRWPLLKIIIITSLIFGIMHTVGGGRDITNVIDTGILGAIYFLIFYLRRNLYCSASAHSFYNVWIVLT